MNEGTDIAVYHSRLKMVLLAGGTSIFVAAAPIVVVAAFREKPSDAVIGVLFALLDVLFFGSGLLWAVDVLRRRTPALILTAEGLTDQSTVFRPGFIPWHEIAGVDRSRVYLNSVLCLQLRDQAGFLRRQTPFKRLWFASNRLLGYSPATIMATGLSMKPGELADLIEARLNSGKGPSLPSPPGPLDFQTW